MAFLVGGANSSAVTAYDIDNSLRLNDDDSAYLSWTPSTATNDDKLTFSFWVKRGAISGSYKILTRYTSSDDRFYIAFWPTDKIYIYQKVGGVESFNLQTNRLFRDPSAWYHIVVAFDTTQATEANRIKLYVNGTQETSFSTSNYPTQNLDLYYQTATSVLVKIGQYDSSQYYDGYLSDVYLIDGTQYDASAFGETDADSGIWKPKKASVTYGTNGFFLEFKETGTDQDASGIGADTSGEDNHLAVTNLAATDQCTDTPTNNFCTINPLIPTGNYVYAEGNTKFTSGYDNIFAWGTMGIPADSSTGWYFELRLGSAPVGASGYGLGVGIADFTYAVETHGLGTDGAHPLSSTTMFGIKTNYAYDADYSLTVGTGQLIDLNVASSVGQIIQIAWKDSKIYCGVDNTWYAADAETDGDPAGGSNQSHTVSGTYNADLWMPMVWTNIGGIALSAFNFGNPSWSLSSGESDANGYGNFEYAPPSGFYALCTKNLAEYG